MPAGADPILARVDAFVRDHGLCEGVECLRAGFSGGADSTALLVLLAAARWVPFEAVHLNHGLRGEDADADEDWCRGFCARRAIPFTSVRLEVPDRRLRAEGTEEAARRLRLEYWRRTTPATHAVALAHHADDSLEDLLLRLTRGANSSGLTALRPVRVVDGIRLVRPLLCLRRGEIETLLRERGVQDWREDATNRDVSFRRNAVRHRWLPLIRETVGHDAGLLRSLEALRDDADFLDAAARQGMACTATAAGLRTLPGALLPRVLRFWLQAQTGTDTIPSREGIHRLREAVARFRAGSTLVPLGSGITVALTAKGIRLAREQEPLGERSWTWRRDAVLDLPETGAGFEAEPVADVRHAILDPDVACEIFRESALAATLHVRSWRPGDRLVPFGRHSAVKLQDLFTEAKVPRDRRRRVPLLLSGDTVIWVPGVRRAEFGRAARGEPAVRLRYRAALDGDGCGIPCRDE